MPIYRYYSRLFPSNLPPLFPVPLSGYFKIMTPVDTFDYRRRNPSADDSTSSPAENKREGPIVRQILPIARNREGESEDRSDTGRGHRPCRWRLPFPTTADL